MHLAHVISPYFHGEIIPYTLSQSSRSSEAPPRWSNDRPQATPRFKKKKTGCCSLRASWRLRQRTIGRKLKPESGMCFFQGFRREGCCILVHFLGFQFYIVTRASRLIQLWCPNGIRFVLRVSPASVVIIDRRHKLQPSHVPEQLSLLHHMFRIVRVVA